MKMMSMKDHNLAFMEIWNGVQVYLGQRVASLVADLYVLDLCLEKLSEVKDKKTKTVFENLLHVWTLITLKNDELINELDHPLIERTMHEYCQKLVPEALGILESITAGEEILGSPFANEQG
jgi:hypothetical protein